MDLDRDTKKTLKWDSGTRKIKSNSECIKGATYTKSFACFKCRTAHKRHFGDFIEHPISMKCPICEDTTYNLGRHFKAPKKSDLEQWKKVEFLVSHGFVFQKIRPYSNGSSITYPKTLAEAKDFVVKYKKWAI